MDVFKPPQFSQCNYQRFYSSESSTTLTFYYSSKKREISHPRNYLSTKSNKVLEKIAYQVLIKCLNGGQILVFELIK